MNEASRRQAEIRRASGRFYTPPEVVRYIVARTLDPLLAHGRCGGTLRILEPACGEGAFLQEAYRWLREAGAGPGALSCLFGLDRDAQAVARTRQALRCEAAGGGAAPAELERRLVHHIRWGDALLGPDLEPPAREVEAERFDWKSEFPEVFAGPSGGFDAVIGNPPYVNIRLLTRHQGEGVKGYLRRKFRCARGAYDLYVLFLELAWHLLRPGGLCGMIVPNKIATMQYAAACRSLLGDQTALLEIADLSRCRVFPQAGVYPYVLIWRKQVPSHEHRIGVVPIDSLASLPGATVARHVFQRELDARSGWHLHGSLTVEDRVSTQPLQEVADLHSGTTGFQARQVALEIRERQAAEVATGFDFVVTGNVDRYRVCPGPLRFMNQRFARPFLPAEAACLTARKRSLYGSPKILVAGMTRQLEAAWDPGGLAPGVQLYALLPKIEPHYLLALLNSKLMTHLFRLRFQAKRLAGDYLSINMGQLAALPIRRIDPHAPDDHRRAAELTALAREMIRLRSPIDPVGERASSDLLARQRVVDRQIDRLVYDLYALTAEEIEQVEAEGVGSFRSNAPPDGTPMAENDSQPPLVAHRPR